MRRASSQRSSRPDDLLAVITAVTTSRETVGSFEPVVLFPDDGTVYVHDAALLTLFSDCQQFRMRSSVGVYTVPAVLFQEFCVSPAPASVVMVDPRVGAMLERLFKGDVAFLSTAIEVDLFEALRRRALGFGISQGEGICKLFFERRVSEPECRHVCFRISRDFARDYFGMTRMLVGRERMGIARAGALLLARGGRVPVIGTPSVAARELVALLNCGKVLSTDLAALRRLCAHLKCAHCFSWPPCLPGKLVPTMVGAVEAILMDLQRPARDERESFVSSVVARLAATPAWVEGCYDIVLAQVRGFVRARPSFASLMGSVMGRMRPAVTGSEQGPCDSWGECLPSGGLLGCILQDDDAAGLAEYVGSELEGDFNAVISSQLPLPEVIGSGVSLLAAAAGYGANRCVRLLLESGARADSSALAAGCAGGGNEVVRLLVPEEGQVDGLALARASACGWNLEGLRLALSRGFGPTGVTRDVFGELCEACALAGCETTSAHLVCHSRESFELFLHRSGVGGEEFLPVGRGVFGVSSVAGGCFVAATAEGGRILKAESPGRPYVRVEDGVFAIGDGAFSPAGRGDSMLRLVLMSASLVLIGSDAFAFCRRLRVLRLPRAIARIGARAFAGCEQLVRVVLEAGTKLEMVGAWAFGGCCTLRSFRLRNEQYLMVGEGAREEVVIDLRPPSHLARPASMRLLERPPSSLLLGCRAGRTSAAIRPAKSAVNGADVEWKLPAALAMVDRDAFEGCDVLAGVDGLTAVTAIGENAFQSLKSLASIVLPECLITIGAGAFQNCGALANMVIPAGVRTIGRGAFMACSALRSVLFQGPLSMFEVELFAQCVSLADVMIPSALTVVGDRAFAGCERLQTISFRDGVSRLQVIGREAFADCRRLICLRLPRSLRAVGEEAFRGCLKIASLEIPRNVKILGAGAFSGCSALRVVDCPASVVAIGANSFDGCALEKLPVPQKHWFRRRRVWQGRSPDRWLQ